MTTDYVHVELFSSLPYSGNAAIASLSFRMRVVWPQCRCCGLKLQAFGARWRSCSADSRLQNLYVPATPYVRGARRRPKQLVVKSTTDPFAAVYPLSAVVARSREMKIGVSGLSSCSRARTAGVPGCRPRAARSPRREVLWPQYRGWVWQALHAKDGSSRAGHTNCSGRASCAAVEPLTDAARWPRMVFSG